MRAYLFLLILLSLLLSSCARPPREPVAYTPPPPAAKENVPQRVPGWMKPYMVDGKVYYPLPSAEGYEEVCLASWYGPGFHGRQAASGEVYNMYEYTAAHKILPIGTYVLVKNLENGRELVVRINDRGPFVGDRCIDLSYASALALGLVGKGTARVKIIALSEAELSNGVYVYRNQPNFRFSEFYLQVGAFKNYANALRYKEELERDFSRVEIVPFEHPQHGLMYRVQVFLGEDLYLAYKHAERLKKERFRTGFLVAK